MLKISLIILVLTLITNSLFFNSQVVVSPETKAIFSIENKSTDFIRYIVCKDNNRVGDRSTQTLIRPDQKIEIASEFLNSTAESKIITIFILVADQEGSSTLLENQFDSDCSPNSADIVHTDIKISKISSASLVVEGKTVSNGIQKLIPIINIDNTAHLVGTGLAKIYQSEGNNNLESYVPATTGLVYTSTNKDQNEICIDQKLTRIELKPYLEDKKIVYLGFVGLKEEKYVIWPKSESDCQLKPNSAESFSIYQNQYAIAKSSSTINPMYRATGLTISNIVDKKLK
jgi:hypothetical protein